MNLLLTSYHERTAIGNNRFNNVKEAPELMGKTAKSF